MKNKLPISPRNNYLVLEEIEEVTPGGLYIARLTANTHNNHEIDCKVLAVGPGTHTPLGVLVPSEVKVGDTVRVLKRMTTPFIHQGVEYLMLKDTTIIYVQ
jgi:co-chaperonin GroES (HSP10)